MHATKTTHPSRQYLIAAGAATLLLLGLAGCSADPTAEVADRPTLAQVYDEIDDLAGQERTERLVALAAEEEGLDVYGATNSTLVAELVDAFADQYGIEPSYYSAGSSAVLRRLEQERDADYAGNDVVMMNFVDLATLEETGALAPLRTPVTDDLVAGAVTDVAAGTYLSTFIGGWNSDAVDAPPATWEELLTDEDTRLALELDDWQWFATLVKQHFVGELGMTEDAAVGLFRDAARRATFVDGHSTMVELLTAGEYDVAASVYHHRVDEFQDEGAPIAWEPAIEPIVIRPSGVAIMDHVRNPATALLWVEFLLGEEGQRLIVEDGRDPASTIVDGAFSLDYEPIVLDVEASVAERDTWQGLWEELVAEGGSGG